MDTISLPPEIHSELTQILSNLVLGDNNLRSEAEKAVDLRLSQNPELYLLALCQFAVNGGEDVMRSFSLVLLRRLLFRTTSTMGSRDGYRMTLYDHIPGKTLAQMESLLVHSLATEQTASVRRKVVDCISEVANQSMRRGRPWHELQEISFRLLRSPTQAADSGKRESSYLLFANSPNLVLDLDPGNVVGILCEGLRDPIIEPRFDARGWSWPSSELTPPQVRYAALLASTAYLSNIPHDSSNASQLGACTPLVNTMLDTLPFLSTSTSPLGNKSNTAWLTQFIQGMVDLTTTHPHFFQPHLETLLAFLPSLILPPVDAGPTPTVDKPFPSPPSPSGSSSVVVTQSSASQNRGKGGLGLNTNLVITNSTGASLDLPDDDDDERSSLRLAALEFMISLTESRASMVKKVTQWTPVLVRACLEGMAEMDESSEAMDAWRTEDPSSPSVDANDPPTLYEQSLDRLACAIGGKTLLPGAFGLIPSMLVSYDWRSRHAGLMAIAAIAEGTGDVMVNELGKIVDLISPMFSDSHPRVRWAACQCIGQLCTDLEEVLQAQHHAQILNALIPVLEDPEPRVHSHAAAALINFCEGVEPKVLLPYLDEIVTRLLALLSNSNRRYVQEQAITTLAMVADASEVAFVKHYSTIMPLLLNILQNAEGPDYRRLRSKAMECAGLIAIAVGREVFRSDVGPLTEALIRIQKSPMDPSDTQLQSYLVATWGKICQALGPEFEPFLPVVMPNLIASASAKADINVYDDDDERNEREGWETITLDGQLLGIRTSAIEEKCQAFETLAIYCSTLGPRFAPYMAQTMEITLPSLKFYYHEGVREACALLVPLLLSCGKSSNIVTPPMIQATCTQLISVLSVETDISFLGSLYRSVNESLRVVGGSVALTFKDELIECTKRQLSNIAERRRARSRAATSRTADDNEDNREEWGLMGEIEDIALEEMATMVGAFDSAHPLLVAISSVKELGANQWFNEDD